MTPRTVYLAWGASVENPGHDEQAGRDPGSARSQIATPLNPFWARSTSVRTPICSNSTQRAILIQVPIHTSATTVCFCRRSMKPLPNSPQFHPFLPDLGPLESKLYRLGQQLTGTGLDGELVDGLAGLADTDWQQTRVSERKLRWALSLSI